MKTPCLPYRIPEEAGEQQGVGSPSPIHFLFRSSSLLETEPDSIALAMGLIIVHRPLHYTGLPQDFREIKVSNRLGSSPVTLRLPQPR